MLQARRPTGCVAWRSCGRGAWLTARRVASQQVLFQAINYTFTWSEPRTFQTPSVGALGAMLSMTVEEGSSPTSRARIFPDRDRHWLAHPPLKPPNQGVGAREGAGRITLTTHRPPRAPTRLRVILPL